MLCFIVRMHSLETGGERGLTHVYGDPYCSWYFSVWSYFWYWMYCGTCHKYILILFRCQLFVDLYFTCVHLNVCTHVCVFPYKQVRQSLFIWCLSRSELHLLVSLSVCMCVWECVSIHWVYVSWSPQALSTQWAPRLAARGLRCTC